MKMTRLNSGNTKPKGKRSAPKSEDRKTGKKDPHAYIFKDANLGEMPVLNSANAWWIDQAKLTKLVDAYKFYATDDQACFYAGISLTQLSYFQELHPDFYRIKHLAKQDPGLRAKKTIVTSLDKDRDTARWWTERTEKEFNPKLENTNGGKDLYDGLTKEIKDLGEQLRNNKNDNKPDTTEKHASTENTGGAPNAEPDGDRNDTAPTGDELGRQDIPDETSALI